MELSKLPNVLSAVNSKMNSERMFLGVKLEVIENYKLLFAI